MSGEERTHHWLMTSMGSDGSERGDLAEFDRKNALSPPPDMDLLPFDLHEEMVPLHGADAFPDEEISSPIDSVDLDRASVCSIGDEDAGPPSIETQPPDQAEDAEVSGITLSWISSGGHYATSGTSQFGVPIADLESRSEAVPSVLPDLGCSGAIQGPIYGPMLPSGLLTSPILEQSSINYGDTTDDSATGGICGLRNLGNTCFMAAGIQCLVNTPPIAQYFFNHQIGNQEMKGNLASSFSQLIHKIWSGKYSALRPSEFKDAFGLHWRDFRDYRQHDCQEFVTLLLEALRKQMPLLDTEEIEFNEAQASPSKGSALRRKCLSGAINSRPSCSSSSASSISSRSSCPAGGSRESRASSSPTPPQSPQCPPSPLSPGCLKEESIDSGQASPKSSISSSSVDAHLINLRMQPIPEEVKSSTAVVSRMNISNDDISVSGTVSCHDAESVTSDISDSPDGAGTATGPRLQGAGGVTTVRQYNQLARNNFCDNIDCDTSCAEVPKKERDDSSERPSNNAISNCLFSSHCDSSSSHVTSSEGIVNNAQREIIPSSSSHNIKIQLDQVTTTNNKGHLSLVKLEDIMKESKTSNVNVLGKDSMSNNKFLFDSEKYAKSDCKKLKNSVDNLGRSGIKRVKEVNLLVDKMDNSALDSSDERSPKTLNSSLESNSSHLSLNKRMRLEEKNVQYELDKSQGDFCECASVEAPSTSTEGKGQLPTSSVSSVEQKLADRSWKAFIGDTKSAVVDTFYGQFRSSLVCSVCGHTSIKYDPFGTLSVPLPHANEIQISIIFAPVGDSFPTRCLVTLFKVATVRDLKFAVAQLVDVDENALVICEVFDNHIARTVEDNYAAKFLNYASRSIYAFQLSLPPPCADEDDEDEEDYCSSSFSTCGEEVDVVTVDKKDEAIIVSEPCFGEDVVDAVKINEDAVEIVVKKRDVVSKVPLVAQWQQCNICLEEICQTDLKTHANCEDCLLCDDCIEMSCKHHGGGSVPCPVCHARLESCDLLPVDKRKEDKPKARLLRVSVVFRIDTESDDNNKREMQLLGHPKLLCLPSRIKSATLLRQFENILFPDSVYTLLLVDGRGYNCSRCLFSSHCRGCDALLDHEVTLLAGDTICVRFAEITPEQMAAVSMVEDHPSLLGMRQNAPLTLYDCLRTFTQSETLKESESWFCPKCEKKQQATKTISVWKYPPYLIVHLERFLFHGTLSTKVDDKVIFPQDGFDLTDFVGGEQRTPLLYNLYGCVCHMGVAQAGHYTSLVRSPTTGEWHYFNDDSVTRQKPREEEYSTAYLLFYHRQGTNFDLRLPLNFNLPDLPQKLDETDVVGTSEMALVPWVPNLTNPIPCDGSDRTRIHTSSPVSTSDEFCPPKVSPDSRCPSNFCLDRDNPRCPSNFCLDRDYSSADRDNHSSVSSMKDIDISVTSSDNNYMFEDPFVAKLELDKDDSIMENDCYPSSSFMEE